ncbi:TMP21-related [Phytophthora cactorum]|nr:TMP21-related [Phytophthora cactorum]
MSCCVTIVQGHRCFLVDVPKETTFRAEYESPDTTDVMGATSFTAQENGPHWVCVSLDSSNYALPDDASMLRDRVSAIQRNQDYAKVRWPICNCEKSMSLQSSIEGNNHRATWVSVLQIAILLVTGFYQAKHLQTYFHKKKLV